ncbi:lipase family protein [Arenicella chitinivorans]|uniref:lipase family protein n=1 Tax=Arenicella chitinivorans TaxID=1329800 RepID=UPI001676058F|nr:lipase family protein [Arenicella chitinivorans]
MPVLRFSLIISLLLALSACAVTGHHAISLEQTSTVGFELSEVLQLGQLVESAYALFHEAQSNPSPAAPKLAGYRPLANLSGRDDPKSSKREFYGHLLEPLNTPNSLIISVRGTSDAQEWLDDIKFEHRRFSGDPNLGHVELGFKEIYHSFAVHDFGTTDGISIEQYLRHRPDLNQVTLVGHSLGSSLATLLALDIKIKRPNTQVRLLTFASPRTGDNQFSDAFQRHIPNSLRIVNKPDLVPRVPPRAFKFLHIWHESQINSRPLSHIKNSVTCYHSLNTYLHVLTHNNKLPGVAIDHGCHAE